MYNRSVFFAAFVVDSVLMGSGYFQQEIYRIVGAGLAENENLSQAWSKIHEKLVFYDYIENNPTKGDYLERVQWTMKME